MTIKDLVKDRRVEFKFYRDKQLWYGVEGTDFEFPVPIEDIGNATFLAEDKAMMFMRYIRKHYDLKQKAKEAQ